MANGAWEMDEAGQIVLAPLVGYGTATVSDEHCALRVEFVTAPDQPAPQALQLAMTRAQATQLAEAIQQMAISRHAADPETPRH
jgi:hypothetical protein